MKRSVNCRRVTRLLLGGGTFVLGALALLGASWAVPVTAAQPANSAMAARGNVRAPISPSAAVMEVASGQEAGGAKEEATPLVPAPSKAPSPAAAPKAVPPAAVTLSPPSGVEVKEKDSYLINYNNVDMIEYIRFISKISGKNFIFQDADIDFKITIVSEEQSGETEVMAALLQILRIHGLALLEQGNNLLIYKSAEAAKLSQVVIDGGGYDDAPSIITRVFRLSYINPSQISNVIKPLLSNAALVEVSAETRHLIVTDLTANLHKVEDLLKAVDSPNNALEIARYQVRYSPINNLVDLAQAILAPLAAGNPFTMIPQLSTGGVYIVSTPYIIERAMGLLEALDTSNEAIIREAGQGNVGAGGVHNGVFEPGMEDTTFSVYKLQYYSGTNISDMLSSLADGIPNTTTASQDLIMALQNVQWMQETNSMVFSGSPPIVAKIHDLLTSIDVPVRQVFIEMLIIDTTIQNTLSFGLEWMVSGNIQDKMSVRGGSTAAGSGLPGAVATVTPAVPQGVATSIPIGAGFSAGVIGSAIRHNGETFLSLGTLAKALESDSESVILLNPNLLAEDSTTASIFVGSNIPFQTGQAQVGSSTTVNTVTTAIQYEDVGTLLQVTPLLGPSDIVTLEISQNFSEVAPGSAGNLTPTTQKSATTTRVHVPDKQFLVISGLIRDAPSYSRSGVPCLGGLPFVGSLFKQDTMSRGKRNLIIFIRPHIVDNEEEYEELTRSSAIKYQQNTPLQELSGALKADFAEVQQ